jgi:hypothetical protein
MSLKQFLGIAVLAVATLSAISLAKVDVVSAQEAGEADRGGAGGAGGGGAGGAGGGGGGGGGLGGWNSGGAVAAHGEYVYVLHQGMLYQYAAYDLSFIKKTNSIAANPKSRNGRREALNQGRGGIGGEGGGRGGEGGRGGSGGYGGGFGFGGGFDRSEDVATYGEYVYVLQGNTLHKLAAEGLTSEKMVTLAFDAKTQN